MQVLFGAPSMAWGGVFAQYKQALPELDWHSLDEYQLNSLQGVDVLIPTMTPISRELLASADRLKLIQQAGAGLEGVDLDAAREFGIPVANIPTHNSGNADSVAEMTIFMLLGLARRIKEVPQAFADQRIGEPCGITLKGHKIGLIGFGGLGQAIAKRLKAFDVDMVAIKRSTDDALAQRFALQWCESMDALDELLYESDFVILTLPDSESTHHLINDERIGKMRRGTYLLNLGRGGLIDTPALVDALQRGHIAGAGLDVFEQEPLAPDHPLLSENVIATPHIGGVTELSRQGMFEAVIENIRRVMDGSSILNRAV